jgi:hypothetical protein
VLDKLRGLCRRLQTAREASAYDRWDLVIVAGLMVVAAGVFQVYVPAGYIFTGLAAIAVGVLEGRG